MKDAIHYLSEFKINNKYEMKISDLIESNKKSKTKNYIYQEFKDSSVTHAGNLYNINRLLKASVDKPIKKYKLSDLDWILKNIDLTSKKDKLRIQHADLSTPILITKWNGKLVVLDGIHRLKKAIKLDKSYINGKLLSKDELKQALIGNIKNIYEMDNTMEDVKDLQKHGDFTRKPYGFDDNDIRLINGPGFDKLKNKVIGSWKLIDVPVYLNLLNQDLRAKHPSGRPTHPSITDVNIVDKSTLDKINKEYNINIPYHSNGINIIFTTNGQGYEQMPMSKWIFAHRIMEAITELRNKQGTLNKQFIDLLIIPKLIKQQVQQFVNEFYRITTKNDKMNSYLYNDLLLKLLTMRSARNNSKTLIQSDMVQELFAQYVITGKNTFNIGTAIDFLNKDVFDSKLIITDKTKRLLDKKVIELQSNLKTIFDQFIGELIGKVIIY